MSSPPSGLMTAAQDCDLLRQLLAERSNRR